MTRVSKACKAENVSLPKQYWEDCMEKTWRRSKRPPTITESYSGRIEGLHMRPKTLELLEKKALQDVDPVPVFLKRFPTSFCSRNNTKNWQKRLHGTEKILDRKGSRTAHRREGSLAFYTFDRGLHPQCR